MLKLIAVFIAVMIITCFVVVAPPASAHVLVMDDTQTVGAILHIVPDDDPIAGQQATLYFDMSGKLADMNPAVTATVTNDTTSAVELKTNKDGSLVTANYVFPTQGAYSITYKATVGETSYRFTKTQRVSRGEAAGVYSGVQYLWEQALLIASSIGIVAVLIIAFNRRKLIAQQSKL